jgi:radical SAM superfamily enzyme YgiQ (UPF0313 family)
MNILLFNPSWGTTIQGQRYNRSWPPLDLLNVASLLRREGFHAVLTDARAAAIPPDRIQKEVERADWILISTSPLDRWQCPNIDLTPLIRWTGLVPPEKLILCGAHGTSFPEKMMELTGARIIMRGEPEASAVALFKALRDGRDLAAVQSLSMRRGGLILHTPSAPPVDLADLPIPAYGLTSPRSYEYEVLGEPLAVLEASRGCPHRCTYCLKCMYGETIRFKTIDQVEREVENVSALGYRYIYFMDLEFTLDRSRVMGICGMLGRFSMEWCCQTRVDAVDPELLRAMASSGCRLIHYGIESAVPETLHKIRKGTTVSEIENAIRWTKDAHIATAGFFLFGFPWETEASRRETERLARRLNVTYASFHFLTPYAGTNAAAQAGEERPWWMREPMSDSEMKTLRMAHLRYSLRPSYAKELLSNGRNRLSAIRLFFGFLKSFSS